LPSRGPLEIDGNILSIQLIDSSLIKVFVVLLILLILFYCRAEVSFYSALVFTQPLSLC